LYDGNGFHNVISEMLEEKTRVDAYCVSDDVYSFVKGKRGGRSLELVCVHNSDEVCKDCDSDAMDEEEEEEKKDDDDEGLASDLDFLAEGLDKGDW